MSQPDEGALIFKILWRMVVISFGFAVAVVAAGVVMATAIGHDVGAIIDAGYVPDLERQFIRGTVLVIAFAGLSFMLWAIGTIVAEILGYRSIFYHLGLGALCGGAGGLLHPIDAPRMMQVAVATGLVAGGVYWLIAGRRAGDWWPERFRSPVPPSPPPPPPY